MQFDPAPCGVRVDILGAPEYVDMDFVREPWLPRNTGIDAIVYGVRGPAKVPVQADRDGLFVQEKGGFRMYVWRSQ